MRGRWLLGAPGVEVLPTSAWGSGSLALGSVAEVERSLSEDLELWCRSLGAGRELLL